MTGKYKQYLITFNLYDGTVRTVPIDIPLGEPGEDGGYYTPVTEQISSTEFRVSFKPSKEGMPAVDSVTMYSFSPRLTVTETEEGAEVSAEDNLGTSTVFIRNGKNGITPVKGIDYSDGYSIYGLEDTLFAPTDEELMTMHDISLIDTQGRTLQKNDFVISNNGILGRVAGFVNNKTSAMILPILAVGGSDGFSPTATVTRETDGVKITITDKNGTTTQTVPIGAEGNSIYYMDLEVEYPVPDGDIQFFMVQLGALTNRGKGIKPGDIIVASNGTLCKVNSVSDKTADYDPIGTIKGVVSEYVGYSVYYLSLNAEYETESKQYLASKTYLSNDGNGVKIGDLLISSNGVLCKVTSVGESLVHYESIANIGGNVDAYVGYSTYYVDLPFNGLEPIYVSTNKISNNGAGIKIGDIVIFSDGTLCEVTEVTHRGDGSGIARCVPKSNIGGNGSGGNVDQVSIEPAKMDRPKVFFGAPLQQTKDEIVTTFSYRSETLSFDCYAEIKAQGNSTLNWPKKNQTVKLYKDAACTEKYKVDFKGWGKQNKFVMKANWRDLTHVRDIVSVRLEGDCMRSNPDFEELPELLRTSPNLGGIDGFPVAVYAAGVYQGRYMWNIPKDKWMTNMDDELDAHCILCSEDYNSSCFRAAANINGSDWTDEIHDTVPASIKTRWNEIISFVMNSTDDEFVANLDSRIKVSTLIDRHIMGLYSCDYDGYGKNQLYITYDGQQWYAGRYDKDGTWGNYWTGSSMLPSNYGRNQYEDMISGRPGNLLFIRLERLFYQRLQERWEYLKVNELSIPNTINRFRELYDITPPYVIEEDYASTTANGAFTGIPNKTTCTIQQIEKFVVERHAWMDEYMESLTPEVEVPCTGISLNTNTLTFTAEGSQTLTATVTPDGCTDSVTWESDDTSVATVSGGVVTAIANGSATITAKCGEYSASCSVAVSGIEEGDSGGDSSDGDILYSLPEATKFGTADAYIDTGVKLFDTPKDFTILMSGVFALENGIVTPIHCQAGNAGLVIYTYGGRYNFEFNKVSSALGFDFDKVAIVAEQGVVTVCKYIKDGTITSLTVTGSYAQLDLTLKISGDRSNTSLWHGELYDLTVYASALSDEEVTAYLEA